MSETTAGLQRKIKSAADLQSVVRTMKALAASNIGQYEKAVRALGDYRRGVEMGLSICFRRDPPVTPIAPKSGGATSGIVAAVVFGSDQGLVGRFNDAVVDYAAQTLSTLSARPQVWAVGERAHTRLADAGLPPAGLFAVPNSVKAITPLVGQILAQSETVGDQRDAVFELHLFHNRPMSGTVYAPVAQRLLPLDENWRRQLSEPRWPTRNLPEVMGGGATLRGLIREYLFVSLFQACAESLAAENAESAGGDATRGQKHRRIAGGVQRRLSSPASGRDRRRTLRRRLGLRSAERRGKAIGLADGCRRG